MEPWGHIKTLSDEKRTEKSKLTAFSKITVGKTSALLKRDCVQFFTLTHRFLLHFPTRSCSTQPSSSFPKI
jgi:hypothetical protein